MHACSGEGSALLCLHYCYNWMFLLKVGLDHNEPLPQSVGGGLLQSFGDFCLVRPFVRMVRVV